MGHGDLLTTGVARFVWGGGWQAILGSWSRPFDFAQDRSPLSRHCIAVRFGFVWCCELIGSAQVAARLKQTVGRQRNK